MADRTLTVAEAFAGAGGMSLGLHTAGFRGVWAGEANKHACATYRAAFPDVPLVEGMLDGSEAFPTFWADRSHGPLTFGAEPHETLDLLAGGPPCQPFSHAGDKLGQWDPRDGFPVFLKLVERWQPRALLIENVKGLTAERNQAYLTAIVRSLQQLGYRVTWDVLNAADYGVPQRRERFFLVAFRDDDVRARFRWPRPTHSLEALVWDKHQDGTFDRVPPTRYEAAALKLLTRETPRRGTKVYDRWYDAHEARMREPWVTVRQALGDLVREYEPGETLHKPPVPGELDAELVDEGRGGHYEGGSRAKSLLYKRTRPDVPADTVSAAAEQKGSEHCARVALQIKNGRYRTSDYDLDTPSQPVAASWDRDVPKVVVRNLGAGDGLGARPDDVAPTVPAKVAGQSGLAAMDASTVHEWTGSEGTTEPGRVHKRPSRILRRLSHQEVARLQAFPEGHPFKGPSTQIYRQIGNAVPPPLGEVLGRAIARALHQADAAATTYTPRSDQ